MSKKTGVVVALLGMCALSVFLVSCGSSSSRPSGLLYVVSQAENNVTSYGLDLSSGVLSLINSNAATCPAQATCGLPVSISLDPTGATAFVLNQESISGYTVGSDGSLSAPTAAASLPAGQTALAMTRDAAGDFLFVITPGALPSPADCSDQPVSDLNCPSISVFSTKPGSTSATLTGNNCPQTNAPCPYLLNRIPTSPSVLTFSFSGGPAQTLLFVTSNQDLTANHNDNELSVYAVDSSGNLTEQPNSPYTTQPDPLSVLAVNTNPVEQNTGGVFVYVGSQGAVVGSVSVFELCTQQNSACSAADVNNEELVSVGTPKSVGQNPVAMLVDPTNSFLYVACAVGNAVYGFRMTTATGILTGLTPASEPTGTSPVALAMHPSNNDSNAFLYASNLVSNTISGYTLDVTTGSMSNPMAQVLFTPGAPSGMAAR